MAGVAGAGAAGAAHVLPADSSARRLAVACREQPHRRVAAAPLARANFGSARRAAGRQPQHLQRGNHPGARRQSGTDPAGHRRTDSALGARSAPLRAPARRIAPLRFLAAAHAPEHRRNGHGGRAPVSLAGCEPCRAATAPLPPGAQCGACDRPRGPHQPARPRAHGRMARGAARQLPRHRAHRQNGRGAQFREHPARADRFRAGRNHLPRAGGAHARKRGFGSRRNAAADDRCAIAAPDRATVWPAPRGPGGDRPAQWRNPGLREHAHLRSQSVRRWHRG